MKIILDCDPGHDDAIAIVLAGSSPSLEILGITTEAGNQTVEKTTQNAINVTRTLGMKIPVYRGCSRPILRTPLICPEIHGESGLDGVEFPDYPDRPEAMHAVRFMIETLLKEKKVTVVTTGAMTNLAMAIRLEPSILEHIEKIVLMGGSMGAGNISPAAEFNILADAEAAAICFESGCPLFMIGLDVTRQCLVLPEIVERMEKQNTIASRLFCGLMRFFNQTQKDVFGLPGGPLHDPLTIAWLLKPELLKFEPMSVTIDHSDSPSYGRTNCDRKPDSKEASCCQVAVSVDVEAYWDLIEQSLSAYEA